MKKIKNISIIIGTIGIILACGGKNTKSNVQSPGENKTTKTKILNSSANLIQDKTPLKKFNSYLNGFHFYNGNINAQMEAHHYVNQLNEDLYQAVIFDGNGTDAKLMGVEYIVTEKVFKTLSNEEKKLWHSHVYEVKSGELIAPGIPNKAEYELMEKIISTYGKTIHTWHTDQQKVLPVGSPMVMMAFTKDGQLMPNLIKARDKRLNVSTLDKRKQRQTIKKPKTDPLANAWQKGEIKQFIIANQIDSAMLKH